MDGSHIQAVVKYQGARKVKSGSRTFLAKEEQRLWGVCEFDVHSKVREVSRLQNARLCDPARASFQMDLTLEGLPVEIQL